MSRLAAVVFDVDGTLVDSERDGHRGAFNAAFEETGLPDRWDVTTYGRLLHVAGGAKCLAFWFENTGRSPLEAWRLAERLHARKTEIMRGLIEDGRVQARPGAHRLLDELDASGIPVHVATTGTRAWVEPLLDRVFGRRFHDRGRGGLAERREAAVAAGLRCLAADNSYTREDDLSGAALVADGLNDPALVAWFHRRIPRRPKG